MSGQQLLSIVERIERLQAEGRTIKDDIREVYAEAKAGGYDKKAIREIVKRRAKDPDAAAEFDSIVELYEREIAEASRAQARDAREGRAAA